MAIIDFDERKTNERPGVRAVQRGAGMSAYKAREVLDLIRNKPVGEARTILQFSERGAAAEIIKVLDSAVANAGNNNDIPPEELFVAACYADEGPTMKRWRPRARGRATRIRKRTCHITIIVGRYTQSELDAIRDRLAAKGQTSTSASAERARRVARSRKKDAETTPTVDEAEETGPTGTDEADQSAVTDSGETNGSAEETVEAEATADDSGSEGTDADDVRDETDSTRADADPAATETEEKDD